MKMMMTMTTTTTMMMTASSSTLFWPPSVRPRSSSATFTKKFTDAERITTEDGTSHIRVGSRGKADIISSSRKS